MGDFKSLARSCARSVDPHYRRDHDGGLKCCMLLGPGQEMGTCPYQSDPLLRRHSDDQRYKQNSTSSVVQQKQSFCLYEKWSCMKPTAEESAEAEKEAAQQSKGWRYATEAACALAALLWS